MKKRNKQKEKREIIKAFSMILQIGLAMITCMGMSFAIGYYLDRLLGTGFFVIIMLVIGMLAAIRSMLVLTGVYKPGKHQKDKEYLEKEDEEGKENLN